MSKGMLRRKDNGDPPLEFHYNPGSISVSKVIPWRGPPQRNARRAARQEFTGGKPATLRMELLFDATDDASRSVTKAIATLIKWTDPTEESVRRKVPQPPILVLQWGTESYFPCYLKRYKIKYSLFDQGGTPIRATADVTMGEVPDDPKGQNPTSGGASGRRSVVLAAGDTLPSVAYREYGDANLWRGLAEVNGVDDPLRLRPGVALLVPSRSDAEEYSARHPEGSTPVTGAEPVQNGNGRVPAVWHG